MAVLVSLGGKTGGDGFLIAPLDSNYDAELSLATTAGTLAVTLDALPNVANLVFSQTSLTLSTTPTIVNVHSLLPSASRGDTTIRVLDSALTVVESYTVTSIKHIVVNFKGRFEARFATDGAFYNANPIYTSSSTTVVPPGWTWGLEGEPDFVPPAGSVPENLETTGVGRVIRLNNPVALRPHADPVVSTVVSITGETTTGTETFTAGDPLIGQPVNFGPDTYFAGNNPANSLDPPPEEFRAPQKELMALFEINLGASFSPPAIYFRGASQVSGFVAKATTINQQTRATDSRPIAPGAVSAAAEVAEFALPTLQVFSETRIDDLVADYIALPSGASPQRRNLVRRIGHLLPSVSAAKRTAVQAQAVAPDVFTQRQGTLQPVWTMKQVFDGKVDANLHAWPGGSPGASSVVDYLRQFYSFDLQWSPFGFHSDELCGYHKGKLTGDVTRTGNHIGDPHTRTVNGTNYDLQSVGEFTLLRDGSRMELQVRQTPVATQNPVTDWYTGLTACVSVITAMAARLGSHRIALQPGREGKRLEFYVDKKPAILSAEGIDLGGHRVTAFDANGETGLRIDCEDGTVVIVTPSFWNGHNIMNVSVSNTRADEGIMGFVPKDSWLPRLRNGASVGPMPASLHDRYVTLYKTFADSWRVTNQTSLFVYAPGTSTKTFTDTAWPAEKPPCKLKPEFQVPGVQVLKGMPVDKARMICKAVTMKDLHENCVFDVATTGDEVFAKGYLLVQELRLYGTTVQLNGGEAPGRGDRVHVETGEEPVKRSEQALAVTATVLPLTPKRPTPTGTVTFFIDGVPMKRPVNLDERGRARVVVQLKPGEHKIRAAYAGGGEYDYHSSSSANLIYTAGRKDDDKPTPPVPRRKK